MWFSFACFKVIFARVRWDVKSESGIAAKGACICVKSLLHISRSLLHIFRSLLHICGSLLHTLRSYLRV